ncbi:MAG: right-handed parallel beta-helix repeat-containing protein [Ruminococcaceae bacterium]|nr:right-handed parallel beta-helix repeat-containing protein [Oscillospiraceae bacterium]
MKKTVFSSSVGIVPSKTEPNAAKLQEFIMANSENCEIIIEPGFYFLEKKIVLKDLRNVDIKAYDVKFITAYNAACGDESKGAFSYTHCSDCNLYGMSFATENPANISARITAVDLENNTFDVELCEGFSVKGDEIFHGLDTCDENRSNNGDIFMSDSNHRKYEWLDEKHLRFLIWHTNADCLRRIHIGELIALRHTLYASPPFNFYGCQRMLLEDITIETSPGCACVVYPRSADFTFRRFYSRLPVGSNQIYSCCADGIHIKGMTGKLVLEDCHLSNMGDDALNIHNPAGTVYTFENGVLKAGEKPKTDDPNTPVDTLFEDWAWQGDVICFYDAVTVEKVAQAKVVSHEIKDGFNVMELTEVEGEIKPGLKMANSAYYAATEIRNCSVMGSKARGMVLQTENILVENSRFCNISSQGILVSCNTTNWGEMGPTNNAIIRNNLFCNNGVNRKDKSAAGISVSTNDGKFCVDKVDHSNVHKNVTIEGNRFVNLKDAAIFADAVNGITIKDNEMINCCFDIEDRRKEFAYNTVLFNCENIVYENNRIIGDKTREINIE